MGRVAENDAKSKSKGARKWTQHANDIKELLALFDELLIDAVGGVWGGQAHVPARPPDSEPRAARPLAMHVRAARAVPTALVAPLTPPHLPPPCSRAPPPVQAPHLARINKLVAACEANTTCDCLGGTHTWKGCGPACRRQHECKVPAAARTRTPSAT